MSRPDLSTPEGRAIYQAELRTVAVPWRAGGVGAILVAAVWMVVARGLGFGLGDPVFVGSLVLLALGWTLAIVGMIERTRYHRRRMKEPT